MLIVMREIWQETQESIMAACNTYK